MGLSRSLISFLLISLILHAALLAVLPGDGTWVEAIYARHVYPAIGPVVAFLPGLLPFSVASVGIILIAVWVPAYLILNILRWRRGQFSLLRASKRTLAAWLIVGAVLFHGFYLSWGYNYLRPPLEQRLALAGADQSVERRNETARIMVQRAVDAIVPIPNWDRDELNTLIDIAIDSALRDLEGRATPVVSPLKGDLNTGYLAWSGQRGVVIPQTLEAHVDFDLPPFTLPFTAAHEKAHLAGFARERDANFVAWYALTRSDDPRLRFAGYFGVVSHFRNSETNEIAGPLLPYFRASEAYHARKVSQSVQRTSLRVYSVYLRANRMESGLADYAQVSDLIHAWIQQRR